MLEVNAEDRTTLTTLPVLGTYVPVSYPNIAKLAMADPGLVPRCS
ncbi:MAG TPA: hypothetical protein VEQ16_01285 [Acidocella sp.]|nr:hypothetical protein [Acidocella sp.]